MRVGFLAMNLMHNGQTTRMLGMLRNFKKAEVSAVLVLEDNYQVTANAEVRTLCETRLHPASFYGMESVQDEVRRLADESDVIISPNIYDLADVVTVDIATPIVSLSCAEEGYKDPEGNYGSHGSKRFHLAAVSEAAKKGFPESERDRVQVIYSGVDETRLTVDVGREETRKKWFGDDADKKKVILCLVHEGRKDTPNAVAQALRHLPSKWVAVFVGIDTLPGLEDINERCYFCAPQNHVGDLLVAVDCLAMPSKHEGFGLAVFEAWYAGLPTVVCDNSIIQEMAEKHGKMSVGVSTECTLDELATGIFESQQREFVDHAQEVVKENYLASHMAARWEAYLETIIKQDIPISTNSNEDGSGIGTVAAAMVS